MKEIISNTQNGKDESLIEYYTVNITKVGFYKLWLTFCIVIEEVMIVIIFLIVELAALMTVYWLIYN